MLKDYFKFLINSLEEFTINNYDNLGDNYFIDIEDCEKALDFTKALKENPKCKVIDIKHPRGTQYYSTYYLEVRDKKVIFAIENENLNPGFLVTLRNIVAEQKNDFENAILVSVLSSRLNSITEGVKDLSGAKMPLSNKVLYKKIIEKLDANYLTNTEKYTIMNYLEDKIDNSSSIKSSIYEYETILAILQDGEITPDEYAVLGYFPDSELQNLSEKQAKARLNENKLLFEKVKKIDENNNSTDIIQKDFLTEDVQKVKNIAKEIDTNPCDFKKICKLNYDFRRSNKFKLKVESHKYKEVNSLVYLENKNEFILESSNNDTSFELEINEKITFSKAKIKNPNNLTLSYSGRTISINTTYITTWSFVEIVLEHPQNEKKKLRIKVLVLPVELKLSIFDSFNNSYKLEINKNSQKVKIKDLYSNTIKLNKEGQEVDIIQDNQVIDVLKCSKIIFSEMEDVSSIDFALSYYGQNLNLLIDYSGIVVKPLESYEYFRHVVKNKKSIKFINDQNRVEIGSKTYQTSKAIRQFFEDEYLFLKKDVHMIEDSGFGSEIFKLNLPSIVEEKYNEFVKTFIQIPSLSYYSGYQIHLAKELIQEVNTYLSKLEENSYSISEPVLNLLKLGAVKRNGNLYFTPFSILSIAYSIEIFESLSSEDDKYVFKVMSRSNLMPIMSIDGIDYRAKNSTDTLTLWSHYEQFNDQQIGDVEIYLKRIIEDKLKSFKTHYSQIIELKENYNFKVAFINIDNDKYCLFALLNFIKDAIESQKSLRVVVDYVVDKKIKSSFEIFANLSNVNDFNSKFGDGKFNFRNKITDENDLLRIIQKSIELNKVSKNKIANKQYHIVFYKEFAEHNIIMDKSNITTNTLSLNGLVSKQGVYSTNNNGTKIGYFNSIEDSHFNDLTKAVDTFNTLNVYNNNDNKNKSYQKKNTLYINVYNNEVDLLDQLIKNSIWVTLINPDNNFESYANKDDKTIIHFSDQYTDSQNIDAITLTGHTKQFEVILKKHLNSNEVIRNMNKEFNYPNIIKSLNSLSGTWLLKILEKSTENVSIREKLSVVSASKITMKYLYENNSDYSWAPISLEEILRVSRAVGLKIDSILSTNSTETKGNMSDDLMFIGYKTTDKLELKFHVCEVKYANNSSHESKAKEQIENLVKYLNDNLIDSTKKFSKKYYLNFFVELLEGAISKLMSYGLVNYNNCDFKQYSYSSNVLLKKESITSSIVMFNSSLFVPRDGMVGDHMLFERTETQLFEILDQPYLTQKNSNIFQAENINNDESDYVVAPTNYEIENIIEHMPAYNMVAEVNEIPYSTEVEVIEVSKVTEDPIIEEKQTTIYNSIEYGTKENEKIIYSWDYLNDNLTNRHLFAVGKSGSGKTYFIQKALQGLSKMNISSLVIDYTDGYTSSQLEIEFKESVNVQQLLVKVEGCPINPFKKYRYHIEEHEMIDTNNDVGSRVADVFGSIFSQLGIVQKHAIKQAVIKSFEQFGDTFTVEQFGEVLLRIDQTAYIQIESIINSNLFSNEEISWDSVFDQSGKVTVIQLTKYDKSIQKALTEFLLWDFWYYSNIKGTKTKPLPIVLDEAQNLSWDEKAPSYKILTEGRKFGIGAWFATQSFTQLGKVGGVIIDNAATKVYFAVSDNEVRNIAKKIDISSPDRYELILKSLNKGQALVQTKLISELDQKEDLLKLNISSIKNK